MDTKLLKIIIEMHKRTDVNKLSDNEWLEFQKERIVLESKLREVESNG